MTPQSLKEEVLREFAHALFDDFETNKNDYWSATELSKSFLSSAIDKAYAAGKQDGIREEGTATKNSSGRYLLGYDDGYAKGRADACSEIQLGLDNAPDGEKTMGLDAFEGDFVRDLIEAVRNKKQ